MEKLCVYVDHLKKGTTYHIEEETSSDFLELKEEDCRADKPLKFRGEAYLAEGDLVVHLDIATQITMRCSICNEEVEVPIDLSDVYLTATAERLSHAVFDMREPLREEILVAIPNFVECHGGVCPHRPEIDKYLKKGDAEEEDGSYRPFADL
jgi:uncharacterized metal-binding protein YceD (DUF177 family)